MKTTLMTRERCIAPAVVPVHGTSLSGAGLSVAAAFGTAFGTALPGPPRGAPV